MTGTETDVGRERPASGRGAGASVLPAASRLAILVVALALAFGIPAGGAWASSLFAGGYEMNVMPALRGSATITWRDGVTGSVIKSQTVKAGTAVLMPDAPVKSGYCFNSWLAVYKKQPNYSTMTWREFAVAASSAAAATSWKVTEDELAHLERQASRGDASSKARLAELKARAEKEKADTLGNTKYSNRLSPGNVIYMTSGDDVDIRAHYSRVDNSKAKWRALGDSAAAEYSLGREMTGVTRKWSNSSTVYYYKGNDDNAGGRVYLDRLGGVAWSLPGGKSWGSFFPAFCAKMAGLSDQRYYPADRTSFISKTAADRYLKGNRGYVEHANDGTYVPRIGDLVWAKDTRDTSYDGYKGIVVDVDVSRGQATVCWGDRGNKTARLAVRFGDRSMATSFTTLNVPSPPAINISKAALAGVSSSYDYTGSAVKPKPKLTIGGKAYALTGSFKLAYSGNVKPGSASVSVTGSGAFAGTASKAFRIIAGPTLYYGRDASGSIRLSTNRSALKSDVMAIGCSCKTGSPVHEFRSSSRTGGYRWAYASTGADYQKMRASGAWTYMGIAYRSDPAKTRTHMLYSSGSIVSPLTRGAQAWVWAANYPGKAAADAKYARKYPYSMVAGYTV